MDDTFTVLPCNLVQEFLSHLNSIEACIQLTFEKETEDGKPFLDVYLCKEFDGSVTTSVYGKPTHTNQYLPFESHHPVVHKASVVWTLKRRATELSLNGVVCTHGRGGESCGCLKQDGYLLNFIQRHSCCSNLPRPVEEDQRPTRTSLFFPHISVLLETI